MTAAEIKQVVDDAFAAAEKAAGAHLYVVFALKTANAVVDQYVLPALLDALKGRGVVAG